MTEYGALIRLGSSELSQGLRRNAPPKGVGQWILALVDIACTDYYSVNQEPSINLTVTSHFDVITRSRFDVMYFRWSQWQGCDIKRE